MKIIAKKVKCKHLMPGDLFSLLDQSFWDGCALITNKNGDLPIGQMVYIRTDAKCPDEEKDDDIYRITIKNK